MARTSSLPHPLCLPLALLLSACAGGDLGLPSENGTEQLLLILGDEQVGLPGRPLPQHLVVRLVDKAGSGLPDQTVTWIASAGGGRIRPLAERTDGDGFARAEWTLGPEVGTNTADAVVSHVGLVTFTASATDEAPPVLTIEAIESIDQAAPAGSPVPVRPAVRVTGDGEPVGGIEVRFEVAAGGGSVEDPVRLTNADGIARVGGWILGADPGTNRLEASGEGLVGSPVQFTAEGTGSGPVDRLVFQVEPGDADVRERFRVEVALVDEDGDVVPLSGIVIYLALFRGDNDVPSNSLLIGDRFGETENGVAVFDDIGVTRAGTYRLRALTDDLPEHGPQGPEPHLFSRQFVVD